ncbi:MAG TPA: amidase [Chitinophagaceae bacterium]|jgi:aspartyl-tRNA(Asn)/glutamyl-tRNA(Gln) amidotransferase subunit A|nr:amidase [Chitinophagaceae bacterium]
MSSRRNFIHESLFSFGGLVLYKFIPAHFYYDYCMYTIAQLSELFRQKKISPVEVTQACLQKIRDLNPTLNAFITVTTNEALQQAADAEREIKNGHWRGPLHGVPIALKDLVDTAGIKTTAASGVYQNRIPEEDAPIVKQLKKAGAVIVGKTNMHEFAIGATSAVSFFGVVRNPWNPDYVAGGSSGGSAVAVAAGMCYAAIGSDTGGSNRIPPSCCGVMGLKATYGLISTRGLVPMSKSFDHAGPICRTVEDIAIVMNSIVDEDLSAVAIKMKDYKSSLSKNINPKIGVVSDAEASEEVASIFKAVQELFHSWGWQMTNKDLPIVPSGGIELRNTEIQSFHKPLVEKYRELYNPVTLARLENTMNINKEVNAVDYIHQVDIMNEDRQKISGKLFNDYDVLILPTATAATVTVAEAEAKGPLAMSLKNTLPFNYYGLPALTVPCGFAKNGLPLGLQIVGPRWGEDIVLAVGNYYEQHTKWHLKHPV